MSSFGEQSVSKSEQHEDERARVITDFARSYTAAWCSQDPARVAAHYINNGKLRINDGAPAIGHHAIAEAARSFMTAFPDLQVILDRLITEGEHPEYHWTLSGTNTGPGGTGKRVDISGYEIWSLSADGLIAESAGHFDSALYEQQLHA